MKKPHSNKLQAELRTNTGVKYVDVEENPHLAYIRCESSDAAKAISEKSSEERQYKILEGMYIVEFELE